jgi:hypothetical protein
MVRRAPCKRSTIPRQRGATISRATDGPRRPRLSAFVGRHRESPSAIGPIPEAFLALLSRSKFKGEPAYGALGGRQVGMLHQLAVDTPQRLSFQIEVISKLGVDSLTPADESPQASGDRQGHR